MFLNGLLKKKTTQAFTLIETLVSVVIVLMLVAGMVLFVGRGSRVTKDSIKTSGMEQNLAQFFSVVMRDLKGAGSDPTGQALHAFMIDGICVGKVHFQYGIVPTPADSSCSSIVGELGILSYNAFDENNDGVIEPEEGIDLASAVPTLRAGRGDFVVYDFTNNTVVRRDLGDPDTSTDNYTETVLDNVVDFSVTFWGYDGAGVYGQITSPTRHNDIREVELFVMIHSGQAEEGYTNPGLPANSPFKKHRTIKRKFRNKLIVNKG